MAYHSAQRIMITGASGFLGQRLVKSPGAEHEIIGIDRRPHAGSAAKDRRRIRWYQIELADEAAVTRPFAAHRRQGILHVLLP